MPRIGSGMGTSSTRELFRRVKLNYTKDMCLSFGDYVQENIRNNSLDPRIVGAIALCPRDNYSRSWIIMDLLTGKKLQVRNGRSYQSMILTYGG